MKKKKERLKWKKKGMNFWFVPKYIHPRISIVKQKFDYELIYCWQVTMRIRFNKLSTAKQVAQLIYNG